MPTDYPSGASDASLTVLYKSYYYYYYYHSSCSSITATSRHLRM